MQLNPYPSFNGNCEEAFSLYASTLGGQIETLIRYEGSPMEKHAPPGWGSKIMHARMNVAGIKLMGSDSMPGQYQPPVGIQLSLDLKDEAEAERIFNALAEGGTIKMKLQKTFWARQFGMLTDRFGVPWLVNCE